MRLQYIIIFTTLFILLQSCPYDMKQMNFCYVYPGINNNCLPGNLNSPRAMRDPFICPLFKGVDHYPLLIERGVRENLSSHMQYPIHGYSNILYIDIVNKNMILQNKRHVIYT